MFKISTIKKENIRFIGKCAGLLLTALLLGWYCVHTEYYNAQDIGKVLSDDISFGNLVQYVGQWLRLFFASGRTWFMLAVTVYLGVICLLPNRLSDRANRNLGCAWFLLAPVAVYFSLLYLNASKFSIVFWDLNKIALVFTFWFLYLFLLLLLLVTGSIRASVILMAVSIAVLGIANRFVISFRGMALSAGDLFSLGTALTVAADYEYEIDWYIFSEIVLTFLICVHSCKLRGQKMLSLKPRVLLLCIWLVFSGTFYHICCRTSYLDDNDIRTEGFTHQLRYKKYDMLFTTLLTCFYLAVDKPDGYSLDRVQEIAEPYLGLDDEEEEQTGPEDADASEALSETESTAAAAGLSADDGVQPNVIVIMNESLADYSVIGKTLEFSEDYMPFIHGLTENTIKGYAYASVFGGNTPNSEYEFLTGNTMGFLPVSSVGFHLFVRGNMPSLASELKSVGYTTLAIHPYRGTNYRRNIVYPQIGFDTYYTRLDFKNPYYIRKYISDQTLMERIVEEYENNLETGNRLFSYNVTIQNHGGYYASNSANVGSSVRLLTSGVSTVKAEMYANLVKATDEAFEYLVDYFAEQDDPTVIIMFGDHQPDIGESTYEYLLGNEEELTAEEVMEKYKVPFIAWANYDIEEETIEKTSLNYLYSILADRLGLPMTGYQQYLVDLSEEIPVLAAGGYWTADGDFYELDDEESPYFELVNNYNILEYNYIFGGKNRCLELFELAEE